MREKVLLVDDEIELLETVAERMRIMGMEVFATTSPLEALDRLADEHFDAIVVDLMMPGLDGFDALRAIKKISPEVQVILLSGFATMEITEQALKLGAAGLLEKPPDLKTLCELIRKAKALGKKGKKNGQKRG